MTIYEFVLHVIKYNYFTNRKDCQTNDKRSYESKDVLRYYLELYYKKNHYLMNIIVMFKCLLIFQHILHIERLHIIPWTSSRFIFKEFLNITTIMILLLFQTGN